LKFVQLNAYFLAKVPKSLPELYLMSLLAFGDISILRHINSITSVICAVTLAPAHVQGGEWLYQQHCAQCHGSNLAGNPAWQTELADGSHPPPPLDGGGKARQYSEQDLIKKNGQRGA
jgi:hypothetical protein